MDGTADGGVDIGESYFFRNEYHFRALREQILPEILRENADRREIRIWSAGLPRAKSLTRWRFCSISSCPPIAAEDRCRPRDLPGPCRSSAPTSTPNFCSGRRRVIVPGRFGKPTFRRTRLTSRKGDLRRLAPPVRNHVRFAYLNLVKDVYPSPLTGTLGLDLILFRNVAIYLKPEVIAAILERFHRSLRPGGWLLLGETEVTAAPRNGFDVRRFDQATFFQKHAGWDAVGDTAVPLADSRVDLVCPRSLPITTRERCVARMGAFPGGPANRVQAGRPMPAWQRLERSVQQHDFAAAETILDRISDGPSGRRLD